MHCQACVVLALLERLLLLRSSPQMTKIKNKGKRSGDFVTDNSLQTYPASKRGSTITLQIQLCVKISKIQYLISTPNTKYCIPKYFTRKETSSVQITSQQLHIIDAQLDGIRVVISELNGVNFICPISRASLEL